MVQNGPKWSKMMSKLPRTSIRFEILRISMSKRSTADTISHPRPDILYGSAKCQNPARYAAGRTLSHTPGSSFSTTIWS